MAASAPDTRDALGRLEAALASPAIPPKEAQNCARLVEKLRRPVRVGIFGARRNGTAWLLRTLLGAEPVPRGHDWPTFEIVHGPEARVTATLDDASMLTQTGLPGPDLMEKAPVFLRIEAPIARLQQMSFLYLAAGDGPDEQLSALAWAARRTEIAIWCTGRFGEDEALIWAAAPDRLKHHALLVATDWPGGEADLSRHAGLDFDGVFAVARGEDGSRGQVEGLASRLEADIAEARAADLDAAQLFLHRFGHLAETAPAAAAQPGPAAPRATPAAARPRPETATLVSEPLLYLKRRSRALLEMLEWQDPAAEDWPGQVLSHCNETAEGLRDRAADWPEESPTARALRRTLDEACDTAVLLQIEGGQEQAEDAARLLLQLRCEFERELAA